MKNIDKNKMSSTAKKSKKKRYQCMYEEVEFLYKTTNYRAVSTRKRYREIMLNFIDFVNANYKINFIKNIEKKHIIHYLSERKNSGVKETVLLLEANGILYFLKLIPFRRQHLVFSGKYYLDLMKEEQHESNEN